MLFCLYVQRKATQVEPSNPTWLAANRIDVPAQYPQLSPRSVREKIGTREQTEVGHKSEISPSDGHHIFFLPYPRKQKPSSNTAALR